MKWINIYIHNILNLFLQNSINPSSRILQSSLDIALGKADGCISTAIGFVSLYDFLIKKRGPTKKLYLPMSIY